MTLTSSHFLFAMLDVKVEFVGDLWTFCGICRLRAEECGDGYYNECERDTTKHDSQVGSQLEGVT